MKLLPLLITVVLLVLAVAFGLHCLVLHCDKPKHAGSKRRDPA
jgi:hypothetical protein